MCLALSDHLVDANDILVYLLDKQDAVEAHWWGSSTTSSFLPLSQIYIFFIFFVISNAGPPQYGVVKMQNILIVNAGYCRVL